MQRSAASNVLFTVFARQQCIYIYHITNNYDIYLKSAYWIVIYFVHSFKQATWLIDTDL